MSHRHHEDFRGSRNVEGTGDQVSVQTNSKPNYIAKRAFGQTYNQLSSSNSQITSFENYSNASKQNTKSRIILKPYMNPGENITKVHTNIDIGEVLEDLRKQNSISGLKCLFTLLEDPTLGEQVCYFSSVILLSVQCPRFATIGFRTILTKTNCDWSKIISSEG